MTVVLAHGVFDIFHYGHLVHLQAARALGDVLIVGVTDDAHVNKGPKRPVHKLHQRMALIRALAFVDDVRPFASAEEAIRAVKPGVYVKGREYEGKLREQPLVESLGGRVAFTWHDEGSIIKSSKILRHYENDNNKPAGEGPKL